MCGRQNQLLLKNTDLGGAGEGRRARLLPGREARDRVNGLPPHDRVLVLEPRDELLAEPA